MPVPGEMPTGDPLTDPSMPMPGAEPAVPDASTKPDPAIPDPTAMPLPDPTTPDPTTLPTPDPSSPGTPLPTSSFNSNFGYGLVNANAAVSAALGNATLFADEPTFGGTDDWNVNMVQAPEVWAQGYTGAGVIVAVVDTGVDYRHVDLDANTWVNSGEVIGDGIDNDGNGYVDDINGWDFVDSDHFPLDANGHGTHIAGSIAAERNSVGPTGVAYDATIMPVRVLDASGNGSSLDVALGIRYAASNGADVINLSLGGDTFNSAIFNAIQYASSVGSIVVMSSGNDGAPEPNFPARHADQYGIAVGAVDINMNTPSFSNAAGFGTLDYVVAPGVGIYSTTPSTTFANFTGTSMAAPHVAGVAALVKQANSTMSAADYENIIVTTASLTGVNGSLVMGSPSDYGTGMTTMASLSTQAINTDAIETDAVETQSFDHLHVLATYDADSQPISYTDTIRITVIELDNDADAEIDDIQDNDMIGDFNRVDGVFVEWHIDVLT